MKCPRDVHLEYVAGLAPAEPGYRRIRIEPHIGGGLTSAALSIDTAYGVASSSWRIEDDTIHLQVTVPPGTMADVRIAGMDEVVGVGDHRWESRSRDFCLRSGERNPEPRGDGRRP